VRLAPAAEWAVPAGGLLLAAATVAAGELIQARLGTPLGTPQPPFLMNWAPVLTWHAALAVLVTVAAACAAPRLIAAARSPAMFAGLSYLLALAVALPINAVRGGVTAWSQVFDLGRGGSFEASHEYLPALPQLAHGVGSYVAHFAALLPHLPTHTKGNPPGPVVVMYLLGITSAGRLAAVCIAVGALTAPLGYALGRTFGGEQRGRLAAALVAFTPALILFGVTSVDYAFATLATAIAWLLVSGGRRPRLVGCLLAALGSFLSWLLPAIAVWGVLVVLRREGRRPAVMVGVATAGAILAFNLVLGVTLGYDPIAVLRALGPIYQHGIAAHRPYLYWVLGSPVAWLVMLGLPVAWLALRALAAGDDAAVALAVVVAVSAAGGFTKAETERIWLPFVPLACVAAAALPIRRIRSVLVALGLQALAVELLFNTVW
jgi:methylthioxylose transferase